MLLQWRNGTLVRVLTCLLLVAILALPLPGGELPSMKLRVKDATAVDQSFGALLIRIPVKCDARGNLYVRHYEAGALAALPIVRISPDGKATATFILRAASGFERGNAHDFDIGPRGELYVLASTPPSPEGELARSIVKFTPESKFDSAFELEPYLDARRLGVFSTGEFLVAGEELSEHNRKPTGRPLLAVYDRAGRFIRELSLPRDLQTASGSVGTSQDEEESLHALTEAAAGDDGNIYLMRRTSNPLVYVVSAAGLVLRRFVVSGPGETFYPVTLKVAGSKIVIQFSEKKPSTSFTQGIYVAVDAYTGEKYAEYWDTPETGNIWACYTPEGFTFVTTNKASQMTLQRVTPY